VLIRELDGSDALAGPKLRGLDSAEGARSEGPGPGHCIHGFGRLARETIQNTIFLILRKDRSTKPLMLGDV